MEIRISSSYNIPAAWKKKAVVARCLSDSEDAPVSYGAAFTEDGQPAFITSYDFGDYSIMLDTVPPTIKPKIFSHSLRGKRRISFEITDNFATAGKAKGLRYRATLNRQWLLMEYDLKRDEIFHVFDQPLPVGEHRLEIHVVDDRDNEVIFRRTVKG